MSKNFEKIKSYYHRGLWSMTQLKQVVGKENGITQEEFAAITGEPYTPV